MSEQFDYEPTGGYQIQPLPGESMVVLRPGDRVLIHFRRDVELEIADETLRRLREYYPGVEFGAVTGDVERVVVQRAEEGE